MRDPQRLALLKEIGGAGVYEERRADSLRIMRETESRRLQIQETVRGCLRATCTPFCLPVGHIIMKRGLRLQSMPLVEQPTLMPAASRAQQVAARPAVALKIQSLFDVRCIPVAPPQKLYIYQRLLHVTADGVHR